MTLDGGPELKAMRSWLRIGGALLLLLAGGVVGFWITGNEWVLKLFPGTPTPVNSAVCFAGIGSALFCLAASRIFPTRVLATAVATVAIVTLLQYIFRTSFGIDQFLWKHRLETEFPGRMAINTALGFIVSAAVLFIFAANGRWRRSLAWLGGALLGMVLGVFLGYLAQLQPHSHWSYFNMSLPTAAGFTVVALTGIRLLRTRDDDLALPLFAAASVLLVSLGINSLLTNSAFNDANTWLRHSYEVREQLRRIQIDLRNADIDYLDFTDGVEAWSKRLEATAQDCQDDLAELVRLVADNSIQKGRAKQLSELVQNKFLALTSLPLATPSHGNRILTDQIKSTIDELLSEEDRLLEARIRDIQLATEQTRHLFLLGGVVIAALIAAAFALLHVAQKKRKAVERQLLRTNEELREANAIAEESTRLKAQFLANMSHEIRTPMNGVVGMIGLLLDSPLNSEQKMLANTVRTSADALLAVINDILDFSKIEAGQLIFEESAFDLTDPVENCLSLIAEKAHGKKLELAYLIEENVPLNLIGDASRLHQVLLNLLGNAVKFTEAGEVVLRVAKVTEENRKVRLKFTVRDTGPGIAPDVQSKLFQPFTQADGSTARKYGGTGLGLAICRQLVHLMHGEVGIESELGKGATFWFTAEFPLQEAVPKIVQRKAELAGMRGLIVDDSETNREILSRQLAKWQIDAHAISTPEHAVETLEAGKSGNRPFQFAILDMHMPSQNGLDLADTIRKKPEFEDLKLLLLTSLGSGIPKERLEAAGIGACLSKPPRQSLLHETLLSLLANSSREPSAVGSVQTVPTITADVKLRILLAEDNLVNQQVARMQLGKFGYQPVIVGDGLQALHAVQTHPFDVILMDCQMPELDGFEATRRIRHWEEELRNRGEKVSPSYIVAMTANAMVGDREACLECGMDDYISKPVRAPDLAAALARAPHAHLS